MDDLNRRFIEAGDFEIQVGAASDNILLTRDITVGNPVYLGEEDNTCVKQKPSSHQIDISGEIRDIQATLIQNVQIVEKSSGKVLSFTDENGHFRIKTGNHEILIFRKKGYQSVEIPVDNQSVINVRINYGD